MKIVIDIDGVLCDEDSSDMAERKPYMHRIQKLNNMYERGHEIEIYTSRGMKSTNGDPAASDAKYRTFTETQLKAWGLKYHKLHFGKPNADIYIDNKNMLMTDFFGDRIF